MRRVFPTAVLADVLGEAGCAVIAAQLVLDLLVGAVRPQIQGLSAADRSRVATLFRYCRSADDALAFRAETAVSRLSEGAAQWVSGLSELDELRLYTNDPQLASSAQASALDLKQAMAARAGALSSYFAEFARHRAATVLGLEQLIRQWPVPPGPDNPRATVVWLRTTAHERVVRLLDEVTEQLETASGIDGYSGEVSVSLPWLGSLAIIHTYNASASAAARLAQCWDQLQQLQLSPDAQTAVRTPADASGDAVFFRMAQQRMMHAARQASHVTDSADADFRVLAALCLSD